MGLPGRCGQVFRGRGGNEVPMENVAMATKMEVTNLQPLPISKASDQEILQFDKILARNSATRKFDKRNNNAYCHIGRIV